MDPLDRELCLCFHVSLRKVIKHCRIEKPKVPSQLSECFGAGTGCGWCRPFLEHVFHEMDAGRMPEIDLSPQEYQRLRKEYHRDTGFKSQASRG